MAKPRESREVREARERQEAIERKAELKKLLAEMHTGESCPRDPELQMAKTAVEAIWTRKLLLHVNTGRHKPHILVHTYTCITCKAQVNA